MRVSAVIARTSRLPRYHAGGCGGPRRCRFATGIDTFPPSHLRQFKRYIRDSSDPVACFLVVVADADDSAMDRVWQLAADCAGTNVAVIAAENLGWVAEE